MSSFNYILSKGKKFRSNHPGIYRIKNTNNGKIYIGSASDLQKRYFDHKLSLEKKSHKNRILQAAWNKGANFIFEEVKILKDTDKKNLYALEQKYLDRLKPFGSRGYNICTKVIGPLGVKRKPLTEAHKEKLRKAATGRTHTQETKEKCRIANLGVRHTAERRANISKGRKGINKGIPRPQEVKNKIAASWRKRLAAIGR